MAISLRAANRQIDCWTLLDLSRKGYRLGVVTSGYEDRVAHEIDNATLPQVFEVMVCAEPITHQKPAPSRASEIQT